MFGDSTGVELLSTLAHRECNNIHERLTTQSKRSERLNDNVN